MNTQLIKDLSTKVFEEVKKNPSLRPDQMIDNFILAYTKLVVTECANAVRESAKNQPEDINRAMKVASLDVMERFGV